MGLNDISNSARFVENYKNCVNFFGHKKIICLIFDQLIVITIISNYIQSSSLSSVSIPVFSCHCTAAATVEVEGCSLSDFFNLNEYISFLPI